MDYQISNKAKRWTTALMIIGVIMLVIGIVVGMNGPLFKTRIFANLLSNSFFFFNIAICAMFFLAVQYVAEVGWFVYIKRPLEAITRYIPYGIAILLVLFIVLNLSHGGGLYQWMDPDVMNEGGVHFDEKSAAKGGYFNLVFFWTRFLAFFAIYLMLWKGFMKRTRLSDENPGDILNIHRKNFNKASLFILLFAFISSITSWDWIMSIDLHWRSTLFGWYTFSGGWVSAMVVLVILVLYLKKLGYLPQLNDSHIHDIGKWVFALSFLWSYLWFSQFMLIWYGNMPEEVGYFQVRVEEYKLLFFGMFIVNFVFPMLILMSRDAKRHAGALIFVGIIIIVGHWMDTWIMVMGGSMGPVGQIGFLEIGMAMLFFGLFIRILLNKLSVLPLVSVNDPYFEESIHHEI
ncbi:MAG: quinol:cytochrome C oxidoreductase [Brumimicrobium sp.]